MTAKIVPFPRHTRSSSASKASTGSSASLMMGNRHLCGTDPRWRHFLSASALTPSERAAVLIRSQSSVIRRKVRDDLSPSQGTTWDRFPSNVVARIVPMAETSLTPKELRAQLRRRTVELREAHGWTQAEMAGFLSIGYEAYKKYENRSVLAHHLVPLFCRLVGVSIDFFYTGRSAETPERRVARR